MMISRKKFTIRYFLFFGLVPALILFYSVLSANEVAVIKVQYRQGSDGGTVVWKNAESGFEITPIVVGDNVHLKIMPRLVYDHHKDGVIRLFGAQMELATPFGQWVEIGGTGDQQNEIFREILSQRMGGGNSANTISILVERP